VLENFKSMPKQLKFLTAFGLACFAFLVGPLIPNTALSINGRAVSSAEWWSSGVGVFASLVGLAGPIAGLLLLRKSRYARQAYLGFLALGLIVPYPLFGSPLIAAAGAFVVCLAGVYLYASSSSQRYFSP